MGINISGFERIEISGEYGNGFLDFEWDGPSQCLFVWKGDSSGAAQVYGRVKDLMMCDEATKIHFGKLSYCKAAWGDCAYIMLNYPLSYEQKQEIAKGMESKGYNIAKVAGD